MNAQTQADVRRMAREINDLKRAVRHLQSKAQLGASSIEDDEPLVAFNDDDEPVLIMGRDAEGNFRLSGANGGKVEANSVAPGSITETEIADGAISTPKLRANAIDGMLITGSHIQTRQGAGRMEILDDADAGYVKGWSFDDQLAPATINPRAWNDLGNDNSELLITSGNRYHATNGIAKIRVRGGSPTVRIEGALEVDGSLIMQGSHFIAANNVFASTITLDQGRAVRGVDFGHDSVNLDANGEANISHSLDEVPNAVVCQSTNNGSMRFITAINKTASNFRIRVQNHDGSNAAGVNNVGVQWIAVTN